jgi:predicted GNAT superfamily acetyltransferase
MLKNKHSRGMVVLGAFKSERTLVSLKIGYAREVKEHRSGHVKVNLNAP